MNPNGPSNDQTKKTMWQHLRDFAVFTTVHGIPFTWKSSGRFMRLTWLTIFITCLILCLYQCKKNTDDYLKFDVKTSTVMEITKELDFPSITFCSPFSILRSAVGNVPFISGMLTYGFAEEQLSKKNFAKQVDVNERSCKSDYHSNLTDYLVQKLGLWFDHLNSDNDVLEIEELVQKRYQTELVKCFWKEKEIKCDDVFINRFIDQQSCYTFNVGNEFIHLLKNLQPDRVNYSDYDEKNYVMENRKSAIRLLINVNQSEYCGTSFIRRGAGLFAMLTQKDAPPLKFINTPVYLSPGYVHNVIIKPAIYKRKTENFGLCINYVDIFLFSSGEKYLQGVCFIQCFVGEMLRTCGCYAPTFAGYSSVFKKVSDKFKVNISSIKACELDKLPCVQDLVTKMYSMPMVKICPTCKTPCNEIQYDFQLTKAKIRTAKLRRDLNSSFTQVELKNETFLLKNFFSVSFTFESKYAEVVMETQDITITELFIAYGNNIGLFLGMSFMSIFEIINHVICQSIEVFFRFLFSKYQVIYRKTIRIRGVRRRRRKVTTQL